MSDAGRLQSFAGWETAGTIRDGAWTYEALLESTHALEVRIRTAAEHTTLPDDVDPEFVDQLVCELVERDG